MKTPSKIYISAVLTLIAPTTSWGFTENVEAGTTVSDETVTNGTQKVYGTTNDITVGNKGRQYVYSGGTVNNTIVNNSNSAGLYIENDAIGNDISLINGTISVSAGGELNAFTMENGSVQLGGVVNGATLSGGQITINNGVNGINDPYTGGKANNVILTNSNLENRFGIDTNTVVNEGAILNTGSKFDLGWVNTGTSINAIINQGGIQQVDNGATSIGSTVNIGGNLELTYFMHTSPIDNAPPSRGKAQDSIVYGTMTSNGGSDSNTTIKNGGIFNLSGNASDNFYAESTGATIEQGGTANLSKDTLANNWNIQGTTTLTSDTATIDSSTVTAGGRLQLNAGTASSTSILSGGKVLVDAHATLENTSVSGTLIAYSGSSILGNLTINTDGQAEIYNNTNLNLSTVSLAGDLYLNNAQNIYNYDFSFDTLDMNDGTIYFSPLNQSSSTSLNDVTAMLTVNELRGSGTFYFNTAISNQQGNHLTVTGTANGQFSIHVADTGANPAKDDSLELVHIGSGDADFRLSNINETVDIGTYEYELVSNGQGEWNLKQKSLIPIDPVNPVDPITPPRYQITPSAASVLSIASVSPLIFNAELNQVSRHMNDTRHSIHESGVWGKAAFGHKHVDLDQAYYKMDLAGITLGADHVFSTQHGQYTQGGFVSYTDADVKFARGGTGNVKSYGLGLYANYLDDNGLYIDGILKANLFRHTSSPTMTSGNKTSGHYTNQGIGVKLEVGKYFNFDQTYITPFVGMSAYTSNSSNYNLSNGMHAAIGHQKSAIASAGAEIGHTFKVQEIDVKPYARLSIEHEFVDNNNVNINHGDRFSNNLSGSRGVIQTGINMSLSNELAFNLDTQYSNGKNIEDPLTVSLNVTYSF